MIAGTYVQTDQIRRGVRRHPADRQPGRRRGRSRRAGVHERHRLRTQTIDEALGAARRARSAASLAPQGELIETGSLVVDGKAVASRASRRRSSSSDVGAPFNPLQLVARAPAAAPGEVVVNRKLADDQQPARRAARRRDAPAPASSPCAARRHRRLRRTWPRSAAPRSSCARLADVQRWYQRAGRGHAASSCPAAPGVTPERARAASCEPRCRGSLRGEDRRRRRRPTTPKQINDQHRRLPHAGAARLRGRRAARRRVHHLQHVLDHRRAARARVRAAALAGRHARARSLGGGRRGGAGARRRRLGRWAARRARVRRGARRAVRRRGDGHPARRHGARAAHDRRRAGRRHRRDRWRPRCSRPCARRACRRSPRCATSVAEPRAAARRAAAALRRARRARRRRPCSCRACSAAAPPSSRLGAMGLRRGAGVRRRRDRSRATSCDRSPPRSGWPLERLRPRDRRARARERDAQPGPHRDHRRRADGRPRRSSSSWRSSPPG